MSLLDGYEDIFENPLADAAVEEAELRDINNEIAFENMIPDEVDPDQAAFESSLAELDKILAQESKGIKDVHLDDSDAAYIMGEEDDTPDDDIHFDDAEDIATEFFNRMPEMDMSEILEIGLPAYEKKYNVQISSDTKALKAKMQASIDATKENNWDIEYKFLNIAKRAVCVDKTKFGKKDVMEVMFLISGKDKVTTTSLKHLQFLAMKQKKKESSSKATESLDDALMMLKENHEYLMATEGTDPALEASADDLLKRNVDERAIINFLNGLERNKGWSIASNVQQLEKTMRSVRSKQFVAMNIAMATTVGYSNAWGNASTLADQKSTEVKMIGGKAVGLSRNASNGRVTTIWILVTKDGHKLKLKWFSYKKILKSDFSETGSVSTDSIDPLQSAISDMYAALEGNDNEMDIDAEEGEGEFDIDDDMDEDEDEDSEDDVDDEELEDSED